VEIIRDFAVTEEQVELGRQRDNQKEFLRHLLGGWRYPTVRKTKKQYALAKEQAQRKTAHLKRKKALALEASRLGGHNKARGAKEEASATLALLHARWQERMGAVK
jgi:hypothetical protein